LIVCCQCLSLTPIKSFRFLLFHFFSQNVGTIVAHIQDRSQIAATGILAALQQQQNDDYFAFKTEFLHACIYAGEYGLAQAVVTQHWPRPMSSTSVQYVLRYYYLRGCVHLNCHNYKMAVRCFWTCLSVPADSNVVSAIAVAAWKKLVLVQCVVAASSLENNNNNNNTLDTPPKTGPLSTPKDMPTSLQRFLAQAKPPAGSLSLGTAVEGSHSNSNSQHHRRNSDSPLTSPRRNPLPPPPEAANVMHMVELDDVLAGGGGSDRMPSLGVRVYRELVRAFVAVERAAFDAILCEHAPLFREDGNFGFLAAFVATALRHRQVYQTARRYAALPLPRLVEELQLESEDAARGLLQQLATEQWPVTVDAEQMVVFPPQPPVAAVTLSPEELVALTKTVRELDVQLQNSGKYAAFARKANKVVDKSGGAASGGPRGVEDF